VRIAVGNSHVEAQYRQLRLDAASQTLTAL
jgi:hypothetical protein